jgi:hypothetical protein
MNILNAINLKLTHQYLKSALNTIQIHNHDTVHCDVNMQGYPTQYTKIEQQQREYVNE